MKPRVFIGSSKEGLPILEQVVNFLKADCECVRWTDAFSHNRGFLENLIKLTRVTDFAILIATPDDLTLKRDEVTVNPRDNVIFEFGLFVGSAGQNRTFLLADNTTDLPSDLDGVTLFKYVAGMGKYNTLDTICTEQILKTIAAVSAQGELGLLPSTALATGYYYSFLKRVCEELHKNKVLYQGEKEVRIKDFKFEVVIPKDLDDNGVDNFIAMYNNKHALERCKTESASSSNRGYPFQFKIDPPDQDASESVVVHLSDIPTTLNTIKEAMKIYMPTTFVGVDADQDYLEHRELANFSRVLAYLVSRNVTTKKNVVITDNVEL